MVLRSVRTQEEGIFTPHLALTVGVLLAFACVATLVYFVGHMADRINVDTVVELVSDDVRAAMKATVTTEVQAAPPADAFWAGAVAIVDPRRGYLQQLDESGLADWAARNGTALRLLARRGDYVFPGAPIALMSVRVAGAEEAIRNATALATTRGSAGDAEYAVRQLVEVAVRALSAGINDPHTAMSVLNRLGATLCDLAGCHLPSGVTKRNDAVVLVVPNANCRSLVDVMFHLIRQSAAGSTAVAIRMLDVLTAVIACESDAERRRVLLCHADLIRDDAQREIGNEADLAEVVRRHGALVHALAHGVPGKIGASGLRAA